MRAINYKKLSLVVTTSALALSLTACTGAGPDAPTRMIKQVTDGVEASVKDGGNNLEISNLLLVATADGSAVVVGTIVNHAATADALLGIQAGGVQASISGQQTLNFNEPIRFEGEHANAKAVFAGVNPRAGHFVTLQLAFARAGEVTVNAIIRDQRDAYAGITTGAKLATK